MTLDDLDHAAWDGFVQMRKQIKAPLTERAVQLALATLDKLREQGYDPNEVLDQSTLHAWRGLFPLKDREPQKQDSTASWLALRASIRDGKAPSDPVVKQALERMGGLNRLGGMSSRDLDFLRKDFDAALRHVNH